MAYVEVKGVGKDFVGRDGVFTALEDVRLEVEEGEFVSLIGHSGCGKSTVLNLVAGLLPMTRGEILVRGERVKGPGPDRMVVFQNHSLLPWLTLRKKVALAVDRVHRQKTTTERAEIVEAHLAMVHLTKAADRLPSEVSGGMKQRCGIARALSTRPRVLLLDEPFGALDALTRANLQDELLRIWERERITVLMITHDVEEALLLSDRVVMMSNGPSAHVAEIMKVELPHPRNRVRMVHHPSYYRQRGELLQFLNKCKKEKARKPTTAVSLPAGPAPVLATGVEKEEIVVGFVPLLDCAPFAVAAAERLFEKHRLRVTLSRERSWKAISDGLRERRLDASQMVAGMPLVRPRADRLDPKAYTTPAGEFVAVRGISLKVSGGEFISIMGHSGCGKSTVLNMIAGLSTSTRGGVIVDGKEVREPGPDRMVVFQNYSLLPWMTALENVLLAVEHARGGVNNSLLFPNDSRAERRARAERYLELVGLSHALHKLPAEMSGGMRQRVSIARALSLEPRILVLDEPFGALDAITREEMQDELLSIWSETETTGIMVTHEIDEAILLSDRIVMMKNGPAATIGDVFGVPFGRPRTRDDMSESPEYYKLRNRIMQFLYERFAHDDASGDLAGSDATTPEAAPEVAA